MNLRILAMYLPQFHRIPENDAWWGEGFTEWTAVKAAEPLFVGHEQPNEPLDDNYYDLMDKSTMDWQASLMHQYGIDGFCFYHYYFKDGRKILEKPAENLLKWADIDMSFCFSWANESWIRSWSALSENEGNQWSQKFDRQTDDDNDSGVLLEQDYGTEEDWIAHYEYLSPFFKDSRYIKQDNRPLFMIYKPDNILCLREMLECWNRLAIRDGFDGIFSIGTNTSNYREKGLSCTNIQEPQDTIDRFFQGKFDNDKGVMKYLSYDDVWEKLIYKDVDKTQCLGAFSGYDDSPRREHGATVIYGRSLEIFQKGMSALMRKAERNESPFIFVNAWNEWGEGMYLEPDKKYGYSFLQAIKRAKAQVSINGSTGLSDTDEYEKVLKSENDALKGQNNRYRTYWTTFDRWVSLLEDGRSIDDILIRLGVKRAMIYGYGMLGKHLVRQIKDAEIVGVIDQRKVTVSGKKDSYTLDDTLPDADIVIVTVMYDYDNVSSRLREKTDAKIISLYDFLKM